MFIRFQVPTLLERVDLISRINHSIKMKLTALIARANTIIFPHTQGIDIGILKNGISGSELEKWCRNGCGFSFPIFRDGIEKN